VLWIESERVNPVALAVFMALWANLHASFFLGIAIAVLYAAVGRVRWWAPVVCVVAPLANPYGWRLYEHLARYLTDSELLAGMDWVLQHHASVTPPIRVVNMSLGRPLDTGETLSGSIFHPEIQSLYNLGIVVVASAGNDPTHEITDFVPAGFPEVLAVASTVAANGIRTCLLGGLDIPPVPADAASVFTTDGAGVTISAPGEEWTDMVSLPLIGCQGLQYGTLSTTLGTGGATRKLVPSLAEARGTSFSAPLVTGAVARIMQKALVPLDSGSSTVEGVRSWLKNNASQAGVAPVDNPLTPAFYPYSFDGVREGIAQAPK